MNQLKSIFILIIMIGIASSVSLNRYKDYLVVGGSYDGHTLKNDYYERYYVYNSSGKYITTVTPKVTAEYIPGVFLTSNGNLLVQNDLPIASAGKKLKKLSGFNIENANNFKYPPDLVMDNIKFVKDPKFDTYERPPENLYGGEYGTIEFDITNSGRGTANLVLIEMDGSVKGTDLIASLEGVASSHDGGEFTEHISIPISAPLSTVDMMYNFTIKATEYNGFDAEPITFSLQVLAVPQPQFQLENLTWDDDKKKDSWGNGDGIINKGEAIEAVATIKNIGNGSARDVNFKITMDNKPDGFFLNEDQQLSFHADGLMPNGMVDIPFYFVTNKKIEADNFIINLNVTEESGEFGNSFNLIFYRDIEWDFNDMSSLLHSSYTWEYSCDCASLRNCGNTKTIYFNNIEKTYNDDRGTDQGTFSLSGTNEIALVLNGYSYTGIINNNGIILFDDSALHPDYCWKMTPK